MLSSLTAGLIFGLSAGLAPGPLLTFVITQTLKYNIKEGVKVALSPLITDFPIILISLFILNQLNNFEPILGGISCAGAFFVLYLSIESLRSAPLKIKNQKVPAKSLKKGAIVNLLNPHPYLFWFGVGAPTMLKAKADNLVAPLLFILCFYSLLVGSKIFLAIAVGKSRNFLKGKAYLYVVRILGGCLFIFAILLFKDALKLFGLWD